MFRTKTSEKLRAEADELRQRYERIEAQAEERENAKNAQIVVQGRVDALEQELAEHERVVEQSRELRDSISRRQHLLSELNARRHSLANRLDATVDGGGNADAVLAVQRELSETEAALNNINAAIDVDTAYLAALDANIADDAEHIDHSVAQLIEHLCHQPCMHREAVGEGRGR